MMAKRSLRASPAGIEKAKQAFKRTGLTQEQLAATAGIETRQPVWKFFTGKPIERHIFIELCFQLNLDPDEIAEQPEPLAQPPTDATETETLAELVQQARSRRYEKIQVQCGTLRLLDVAKPVALSDIYVNIHILGAIAGQRWLEITDLQNNQQASDRLGLGQVEPERIAALEAVANYPKLMVLGKPGAGKTTFLQKIAIQCNQAEIQPERIPIFIRLRNFVEDSPDLSSFSLLDYLRRELSEAILSDSQVESLLRQGYGLILLDGLDEVPELHHPEIFRQIRQLSEEYYKNQIIITCRLAAQQYHFQGFTEVELADFDQSQIVSFAHNWFLAVGKTSPVAGLAKAAQFIEKLQLPENQPIRELARTPLLLNLACSVFAAKMEFPSKRSELYKQGLDILLVRWDEARGIKRDDVYRQLSLPNKIKLLSQIAAATFEQGHYFFGQNTVQQHIADYLRTLPNVSSDLEVLQLSSAAVLKSIEAQHGLLVERAKGVYSFSHLTFQEYLTARYIIASPDSPSLEQQLTQLAQHMTEPRWREVILLTAGMLSSADQLLLSMRKYADALLAPEEPLQQLLTWLQQKAASVQATYKPAAVRAFYLTQTLSRDFNLSRDLNLPLALDLALSGNLAPDLSLDLALERILTLSLSLTQNPTLERILDFSFAWPSERELAHDRPLQQALQPLKNQLPDLQLGREALTSWWQTEGSAWITQLRTVMAQHRNIGHQWQFSDRQQQLLRQYYEANRFLLDCLHSDCQVSATVAEAIQYTLLMPH